MCEISFFMTNFKPQKMTTVCEVLTSQRNMFAHVMLEYICIILTIYFVIYTLVAFPLEILKVQRKVYRGMTPNKNLILIITILERMKWFRCVGNAMRNPNILLNSHQVLLFGLYTKKLCISFSKSCVV
jgi:hypothetical protein